MSATPELPSADQATATLDQLYGERFLSKMAEYGYVPGNEQEAMAMLETAAQLDSLPETKAAAQEPVNPFAQANEQLSAHLSSQGYDLDFQKQAAEHERQTLVTALASNPEIYKAALVTELSQGESN